MTARLRGRFVSTFRALRNRNYRFYAGGQLVSNIGTWMQRIAQDWLVVILTGASGMAVGTTVALQFLPMLLFGLWGGVLADRLPKRPILIATRTSMGLVSLALATLTVTGVVAVWHVYALAFVLGVITALDNPTRQSFVVEVVGREDLPNAVGLNSATFNLARVIGPAIAGGLIGLTQGALGGLANIGVVLYLSGLTYVGMLVALLLMRGRELQPGEAAGRGRGQLREALRYVRERPNLLLLIAVAGVLGTFGFNFQMMLALVSKGTFQAGAGAFGLLSTAVAIGALGGSLVAAQRRTPTKQLVVGAALLFGVFEIVAGVMPTYATLALVLVPTGLAALTMSTSVNAYLQLNTSSEIRARVMSLYIIVFLGGKPVATPILGWVGDALGPRYTLIAAGTVCLLATVVAAGAYAQHQGLALRARVRPRPHFEVRPAR